MTRFRSSAIVLVTWWLLLRLLSPWAYALVMVEVNDMRVRLILAGLVMALSTHLIAPHYLVAALTSLALIVVGELLPLGRLDGVILPNYLQAPVFFGLTATWAVLAWQSHRASKHQDQTVSV